MRDCRIVLNPAALRHNLRRVATLAPHSNILAMVKANAYGHGLAFAVDALTDADALGVAFLAEAEQVRQCSTQSIVIMEGAFSLAEWQRAADIGAQCVIHQPCQLEWALQHVVQGATVWLKLNAGMNRLGLRPDQVLEAAQRLRAKGYDLVLAMHFANADTPDHPMNQQQTQCFEHVRATLAPIKTSCCNSAALIAWPAQHGDWVRPGIMLYGSSPFADQSAQQLGLKAVMQVQSVLMATHKLTQGEQVGYGSLWTADRDSQIGVIAIGYGDGYPRTVQCATAQILGQTVPIIGRVSMDMLMVDLTDCAQHIPLGAVVTLWGDSPSVDQIAQHAGTLSYELLCRMTQRPTRIIEQDDHVLY
ncbi:MAG: alanine racemase [Pseudomonadota bacterium]|nr:alanine racemase [Pseudomonadota bacterium]